MKQFYDLIINGMTNNKIEKELAVQLITMFKKDIAVSVDDIAIIGMSSRLPGSENINEYWTNILNSVDCVEDFPESRTKVLYDYLYFHAGDYIKNIKFLQGAYLEGIEKFDYRFFRLSPREACLMDPAHRLFMETVWETIEDAGYGGKKIHGSKTGIYVGYNFNSVYKNMISEVDPYSMSDSVLGNKASIIPSRISQMLDLKGPTMILDTTCSSSNVSLHLACQGIGKGDCEMAVAAGIRLNLLPLYDDNTELGVVACDGKTRAFDNDAGGMVWGEGLVSVLLKPLSKARKDRDNIYAVIKGSAVNHDGTSVSITAPNRTSQTGLIEKAWRDSAIPPETISYIETFGTGTKLGDAIEIEALNDAFKKHTGRKQFCAVSSVKTNIGHLNECSGLAGLVKAVLSLKNKKIPPTNNFNRPNRNIDFCDSALYVNVAARDWISGEHPRRCGVSTFGLSGTNSHIILEEYVQHEDHLTSAGRQTSETVENSYLNLLTFSARSMTSLKALLYQYYYFAKNAHKHNIWDICYTANTGRGHYEFRIAIIIKDLDDLKQKLGKLIHLDFSIEAEPWLHYCEHSIGREYGQSDKSAVITEGKRFELTRLVKTKINEFTASGKCHEKLLSEIAELYSRGADVDWDMLYSGEKPRRVSLPVYQFDKYDCWLQVTAEAKELSNSNMYKRFLMMYADSHEDDIDYEIRLTGRSSGKYTQNEKLTGNVYGKVLGFKEIGVMDNFLDLGGDSLQAISIAGRISRETGMFIGPAVLLKYQTIAEFSEYLDKLYAGGKAELLYAYPEIVAVEDREYYPASYSQKRMFINNKLDASGIGYNIYRVVEVENSIDLQHFENVIEALIKRHEAFRTAVELFNGEIIQRVKTDVDFKVNYMEADKNNLSNIVSNFKQPFDLSSPPLLRVGLVKLEEKKYVLLIDMHHVVTDAVSAEIFWREFALLYRGIELPELRLQYKDFSVWQNKVMESEVAKKQEKYWMKVFGGKLPVLDIPTDYPRPQVLRFEGNTVTFITEDKFGAGIKNIVAETRASLYMVMLAAYNILLSKYTAQEDIIVGTPVVGRLAPQWENVIGMFINMLPIRNYPSGSKTFRAFLEEVKENVISSFENQDYQIDELANKLNTPKILSRHFLFDTVFSVRSIGENKEIINISKSNLSEDIYNISDYDLTFEVVTDKDKIKLHLEYCTSLFRKETAERIIQDYLSIFEAVSDNLDIEIENIELKSSRLITPTDRVYEDVIFNI